jgi:hypothetical protein
MTEQQQAKQFIPQGTMVYWTDPASRHSEEHTSGFYIVAQAPAASDHDAEDLEDMDTILKEAVYILKNGSGGEAEVLHQELRIATESERHQYYVNHRGEYCPHCMSDHIEGGFVDISEGQAFQEVWCNDCDKEWKDSYKLQGYCRN